MVFRSLNIDCYHDISNITGYIIYPNKYANGIKNGTYFPRLIIDANCGYWLLVLARGWNVSRETAITGTHEACSYGHNLPLIQYKIWNRKNQPACNVFGYKRKSWTDSFINIWISCLGVITNFLHNTRSRLRERLLWCGVYFVFSFLVLVFCCVCCSLEVQLGILSLL